MQLGLLLGDVAEHHDRTEGPVFIDDRGRAIADRPVRSSGVVPQTCRLEFDGLHRAERDVEGCLADFDGSLVHQPEDLTGGFTYDVLGRQPNQLHCRRVQKRDLTVDVHRQYGIRDRAQCCREPSLPLPQAPLHLVFEERDFNRAAKLRGLHWLEQVAMRLCNLGPLNGSLVGVCGEIDHRHIELAFENLRCLNSVARSFDPDVHQHDVGTPLGSAGDRLVGG